MAGFDSIMSIFTGGGPKVADGAQAPQQQQQQAPQADHSTIQALNPNGNPNNQVPGQQQPPQHNPAGAGQQQDVSPLDQFKDLFTITQDPAKPVDDPNASWFNLNQEEMAAAASKVSFINTPQFTEQAKAALNGDVEAFGSLLNTVMQAGYVRNAMLAGTVSEKAGRAAMEKINTALPGRVRDISSSEAVAQLNPAFQHSAFKPIADMVRGQIQQKYPDASSAEISNMTNQYLTTISAQLNTKPEDPTDHRKVDHSAGSDFSGFF